MPLLWGGGWQLEHVNKSLDDLHRCKAELDMSIADKNETLEMERQCYAMGTPSERRGDPTLRRVGVGTIMSNHNDARCAPLVRYKTPNNVSVSTLSPARVCSWRSPSKAKDTRGAAGLAPGGGVPRPPRVHGLVGHRSLYQDNELLSRGGASSADACPPVDLLTNAHLFHRRAQAAQLWG